MKESSIILSNWSDEIIQSLIRTNAFCIGIFTLDGKMLFSNEAFRLLIKNDPIESFVNPRFEELCKLTKEINPIFTGIITLGDCYSVNTSIEAKVFYKNQQLLVAGGVDVSQLLEYNMMMHRLNRENSNMQRELIKNTRTIEQYMANVKLSNQELERMNHEYATINDELKVSNNEISILNKKLSDTNRQLNELNATKDKFFSIIAHDLRNPFNSLLGFSDLLKRNAANYSTDEIVDFANDMATASKQAFQLVENLLEWSRIQRGIIVPEPNWIPVMELINEVKFISAQQAQLKKIEIKCEVNDNTQTFADREMTRMILRNLVSNAIKFTPENGAIILKVRNTKTDTHFTVIDTGIGIAPEHLERLFLIDNKLSKPGTIGELGTGLGLILCKEFIENQGGQIWAHSSPGVGSEFHFTIPLVWN